MRSLIYVPIIHTELDMGSLAEDIEERTTAIVGANKWQQHKEIVRLYWQAIADYWKKKDVAGVKIFQDGMPTDGTVGKNIVQSLAQKGSINHQIVELLLEKGAQLMKTEDPELVKEEYGLTRALVQRTSLAGTLLALLRYRWRKDKLLQARDTYILKRINECLEDGERGACFLGAFHQILPSMPKDIEVIALKDPKKVRDYAKKWKSSKWEREVKKLGDYLITPITA